MSEFGVDSLSEVDSKSEATAVWDFIIRVWAIPYGHTIWVGGVGKINSLSFYVSAHEHHR